jgi:hypothetical protein
MVIFLVYGKKEKIVEKRFLRKVEDLVYGLVLKFGFFNEKDENW